MMNLNDRQRLILLGVLHDERHLASLPIGRESGLSGADLGRRRIRVRDARDGLVPLALEAWLGVTPTRADIVMASREYEKLEMAGLLHRHRPPGGRRTSHLRLTDKGRKIAKALLAEQSKPLDLGIELLPLEWPLESPPDSGVRAAH